MNNTYFRRETVEAYQFRPDLSSNHNPMPGWLQSAMIKGHVYYVKAMLAGSPDPRLVIEANRAGSEIDQMVYPNQWLVHDTQNITAWKANEFELTFNATDDGPPVGTFDPDNYIVAAFGNDTKLTATDMKDLNPDRVVLIRTARLAVTKAFADGMKRGGALVTKSRDGFDKEGLS